MLYLVIFTLIVILSAMLFLVSVTITSEYIVKGLDDYTILRFSIFKGLIKYVYKIPTETTEAKDKAEDTDSMLSGIWDKIQNLKMVYNAIKQLHDYLAEKMVLKNLSLNVDLGTGDAAYTGVFSGAGWAIAGAVVSVFTDIFRTENIHVDVKPDFTKKVFKVELLCIFNIKLVYIIVVGIKYYFAKKKQKNLRNKKSESGGLNV